MNEDGREDVISISMRESFDPGLVSYVERLQQFTLLPRSGRGTYDTWCELLVSTGNPDRPVDACDTRFKFTTTLARDLRARGYRTVGRYLDEIPGKLAKKLEDGEPEAIIAGGMKLFPIWQLNSRVPTDFTYQKGCDEGLRALERLRYFRFPRSTVCYFAVDMDATDPVITSSVIPYFKGVQSAFSAEGRDYRVGVYGSRNVCSRVSKEAGAVASFLAGMSWGFSGNLGFPLPDNWAFNQIQELSDLQVGDRVIDLDRTAHRPSVDPGVSRLGGDVTPSFDTAELYLNRVHSAALEYGSADANRSVLDLLRHPAYTGASEGWPLFLGPVDQDWIDFANARVPSVDRVDSFSDPATGQRISLDHLSAALLGVMKYGYPQVSQWNGADFGGWLGDLTSFYVSWRNDYEANRSGRDYCLRHLAQPSERSVYGLPDYIEDVDAYHLGRLWSTLTPIGDLLASYYGSPNLYERFDTFYQERFLGDQRQVRDTVIHALTSKPSGAGPAGALRNGLILTRGHTGILLPDLLPREQLEGFADGFAAVTYNLTEDW